MYRTRRNKNRKEQEKSKKKKKKKVTDIDFSYWAGNKVDSKRSNKCRYLDSHSSCRLLDISTDVQVRQFFNQGARASFKKGIRAFLCRVNEQLVMRLAWRTENKTAVAYGRTISCNSFFHALNRDNKGARRENSPGGTMSKDTAEGMLAQLIILFISLED